VDIDDLPTEDKIHMLAELHDVQALVGGMQALDDYPFDVEARQHVEHLR
jgi:hypothetical protein